MSKVLLNAVTAVVNGDATNPAMHKAKGLYQIEISGTSATVKIQGRLSPSLSWVDLVSASANGVGEIDLYPEMRAITTAVTAATVTVIVRD